MGKNAIILSENKKIILIFFLKFCSFIFCIFKNRKWNNKKENIKNR